MRYFSRNSLAEPPVAWASRPPAAECFPVFDGLLSGSIPGMQKGKKIVSSLPGINR
jgi:hypothetical protein